VTTQKWDAARILVGILIGAGSRCVAGPEAPPTESASLHSKLIPWVEVNTLDPVAIDRAVEGLLIWRQITDTAIVSTTPGRAELYRRLKQKVPDFQIVPGLKTHSVLDRFDSVEGWRTIAGDVSAFVEITGSWQVVLENETALKSYAHGNQEMSLEHLRDGLALLPKNVRVVWYPSIYGQDAKTQQRLEAVCRIVAQQCDVQFTDLSIDGPKRIGDRWQGMAREKLKPLSRHPTMPILYCYGDDRWWQDEQIPEAIRMAEGKTVILYPGSKRWPEAARSLSGLLQSQVTRGSP